VTLKRKEKGKQSGVTFEKKGGKTLAIKGKIR